MVRAKGWALGGAVVLAAGAVAAAGPQDVDKKIDRHVQIVRTFGGGSYLGVSLNDTTGDTRGALVGKVTDGSPAAKAGIHDGDLITKFDGETVRSASQLARLVRETPSGRSASLEVKRDGAPVKLDVTVVEREGGHGFSDFDTMAMAMPPEPPDAPDALDAPDAPRAPRAPRAPHAPMAPMGPPPAMFRWHNEGDADGFEFMLNHGPRKLGIRYQEVSGQLAKYFKLAGDEGVLVSDVEADGPAGKAGVKAGDVIVSFNGRSIHDGEDLRHAVADADPGSVATVSVSRDGKPLELKVTLAGEKEKAKESKGDPT